MKKLFVSCGVTALVAATWMTSGAAQDERHPFWDHSDTGEVIHVLPPKAALHSPHDTGPSDAPVLHETVVYPASYGSGNLFDFGGPEISNAGFMAIYWNTAASDSAQTSLGYGTIKEQIDAFISVYSDGTNWDNSSSDDYTIIQQYGSHTFIAPTLTNYGFYLDHQSTSSMIKDSTIRSYLASLFNSHPGMASSSIVYGVYFPPGMRVSLQGGASCTSFCGYHGHFGYQGLDIKYAAFPYLNCSGCSLAGKSVADMLTIVTSHEIREAVTDPDLNAWSDAAGYEADDKCVWHDLYQVSRTSGNTGFWVQPEFSNGGTVTRSGFKATYPGPGCVVPNR
jgi:hypothetical protein